MDANLLRRRGVTSSDDRCSREAEKQGGFSVSVNSPSLLVILLFNNALCSGFEGVLLLYCTSGFIKLILMNMWFEVICAPNIHLRLYIGRPSAGKWTLILL